MENEKRLDLISRQALMAEYDRVHIGAPGGARKLMEDAPTVDAVEVVHGRWVRKAAYNDGVLNTVACSECDTFQPIGCWDYYDYCPHCGAKMDGGNENG